MSSKNNQHAPIDIVVNEATESNEEALANNSTGAEGAVAGDGRGGRTTPRIGVKLKMPSAALRQLTTTYNKLVALKKGESVQGVVVKTIKDVERDLQQLQLLYDRVNPADEAQQAFKDQWYNANVASKVAYLQEAKKALKAPSSKSSSRTAKALLEARAQEALLESRRKKAALLQEERERIEKRRREEEERQLKAKADQLELEMQLEQTRIYRERLELEGSIILDGNGEDEDDVLSLPDRPQSVREWLNSSHGEIAAQQQEVFDEACMPSNATANDAANTQNHLLQHVLLAQAKLPTFKGDLLEFLWFWKSFEMQVERITPNPARRLYLLLQQLEGEPHTLIKGCQLEADASRGYAKAKTLLQERYGSSVSQALALRHQLLTWSSVHTAEDFRKFAVQLQLCQQVKESQRGCSMNELDAATTLLKLVKKLPEKLQMSWQSKVVDLEVNQGREVSFGDFVKFVARHDKARNHPVFGKLEFGKDRSTKSFGARALATAAYENDTTPEAALENEDNQEERVLATSVQQGVPAAGSTMKHNDAFKPPCLLCENESHCAAKCPKAKDMPKSDKLSKLQGLCFGCMKPGHSARTCRNRLRCDECKAFHPTILHTPRPAEDTEKKTVEGITNLATNSGDNYAVAIVPIRLWTTEKDCIVVKAVLDPGSTATFITEEAVSQLGAVANATSLSITTITESKKDTQVGVLNGLKVADYECNASLEVNVAYVVNSLPFDQQIGPEDVAKWPHLQDVPLYWSDAPVGMLIGLNVKRALRPQAVVYGEDDEPYAIKTVLGWALQGPISNTSEKKLDPNIVNCVRADEIACQLNKLYYKDFEDAFQFGVKGWSQSDYEWLRGVEASTVRNAVSGNYTIGLPFKRDLPSNALKNNRSQALQRLSTLSRKFKKESQFKKDYITFMNKMIASGFVEQVRDPLSTEHSHNTAINYVPHHGVYHPRKPNKIRVVFNCASKFRGVALNDCLLSGPDLTNSIIGVLLRFRQHRVAFMADIDAMFYSVLVPEHQRDVLRFLWWPGGDESEPAATYRLRVHLFGATSSPSVANYALRQSAEEARKSELISDEARDTVYRNFYVDDCLKSVATAKEAIQMTAELQRACSFGGFSLNKFVSTSVEVLKSLNKDRLAADLKNVDLSDDKLDPLGSLKERALGVAWDIKEDCLVIKAAECDNNEPVTKRTVLSTLSQVYDPLGIVAPVIIVARIAFRAMTRTQSDWDHPVDSEEAERWTKWCQSLQTLFQIQVPRCYERSSGAEKTKWQLHVFCDASMDAYCTVAYLREEYEQDEARVTFVYGKARVSPPKLVTVPRLELVAAKLASEVVNMIQRELELDVARRFLWTDSTTVLKYLSNSSKKFDIFVTNRVQAILNSTSRTEWRYVPTNQNPADLGSRGLKASQLGESAWLKGPDFLRRKQEHWPCQPEQSWTTDQARDCTVTATAVGDRSEERTMDNLLQHYSSLYKLFRHASIWLRYKAFLQNGHAALRKGPISLVELRTAEQALLRWAQDEQYATERCAIEAGRTVARKSPIFKLSPQIECSTQLLMINSRVRTPIPIVPSGKLAELITEQAHVNQAHLGRQSTAAEVLRKYWVVGLGRIVRRLVKRCPSCQKRNCKPLQTQMAPLPDIRLAGNYAFQNTGVDYFGPFTVTLNKNTIKMYGVIFTCAVTRAVHLEAAESLSTSSFINALRRFLCRRGQVQTMVSDNGTNFDAANNALQQEIRGLIDKQPEIASELQRRNIQWTFNVPGASHHGGFFERLIRSIRRIFSGLTDRAAKLSPEAFNTLLCECEAIMNARPLTTVSDEVNDMEALTPNHLLLGRQGVEPMPRAAQFKNIATTLRMQWKTVQQLAATFWKRWHHEYRCLLHNRAKWHATAKRPLQKNDVVIVLDPVKPREQWRLGRVLKTYPGRDKQIRAADVNTARGVLTRPITKLCLLETASEGSD